LTCQVTDVFDVLLTVAVKSCVLATRTFAIVGTIETATGGVTVTVAVPSFVGSSTETDVIVTGAGLGTAAAVQSRADAALVRMDSIVGK
jgi:hypothetical protein